MLPVENLTIKNYKSIRNLELPCSKVNVFIGSPNAGKSNIIEALSFFSWGCMNYFNQVFRFKSFSDFFYDSQTEIPIEVLLSRFRFSLKGTGTDFHGNYTVIENNNSATGVSFNATIKHLNNVPNIKAPFRFYSFERKTTFSNNSLLELMDPFGANLVSVLVTNKTIRDFVSSLFRSHGFRLQVKPYEQELLMAKDVGDDIFSYPYETISETLRRYIFFMLALETNKDHVLLFDEPETNTFPFYTKQMAERIALDETNQFFFTTHNPYLLASIVEKTPIDKLNIVVTYMDKKTYETKVHPLQKNQFSDVLDSDIFLNLDKYIETDGIPSP